MPTITGLTLRQVELLDTMWTMDTVAEYNEWKETQDATEISTLEQLLFLAIKEESAHTLQDATKVLTNIMKI